MRAFVFSFVFVLSFPLFAQHHQAGLQLSLGVGVLPTYMKDLGQQNIWPMVIAVGYRFKGKLELSAYAGYSQSTSRLQELPDKIQVRYQNNSSVFAFKMALHTTRFDRINIYGGSMLGLYRSSVI